MRARLVISIAFLVCALALSASGQDDEVIISEVVLEGGVTVTLDTVSYYLGLEAGDPLDTEIIAEGFHRLWDSGLFETVRIESETTEDGEVMLYVVITERPFVSTVVFEGNKKVSTSEMKDFLDEKGVDVPRNVPLKMSQLARIQTAIKEIYDEEGFRSARVVYRDSGRGTKPAQGGLSHRGRWKGQDRRDRFRRQRRLSRQQAPRRSQRGQGGQSLPQMGQEDHLHPGKLGGRSGQSAQFLYEQRLPRCQDRRACSRTHRQE